MSNGSEHADLESILNGIRLRPQSAAKDRLLYECGKAAALAHSRQQPQLRWLRFAMITVALGSGVVLGRWSGVDRGTASQDAVLADRHDRVPTSDLPIVSEASDPLLFRAGRETAESMQMHAGMTLIRLQASLNESHLESHQASNTRVDVKDRVWATGPFLDPLRQIEIE